MMYYLLLSWQHNTAGYITMRSYLKKKKRYVCGQGLGSILRDGFRIVSKMVIGGRSDASRVRLICVDQDTIPKRAMHVYVYDSLYKGHLTRYKIYCEGHY